MGEGDPEGLILRQADREFQPFRLGLSIDRFSAGGDGELDAIRLAGGEVVPGAAEGTELDEFHAGPGFREVREGSEGIEADGADAADAFGEDLNGPAWSGCMDASSSSSHG